MDWSTHEGVLAAWRRMGSARLAVRPVDVSPARVPEEYDVSPARVPEEYDVSPARAPEVYDVSPTRDPEVSATGEESVRSAVG
ncbi:MAG: hypothetical protein HOV66_14500 [Streptomycetaceae bacterium]|nr:hypothetical protein [Streptomycetaceae bacterium]